MCRRSRAVFGLASRWFVNSACRRFSTTDRTAGAEAEIVSIGRSVVDENTLAFLVCPLTKGPLRYDNKRHLLISDEISVAYPIEDGIPILMPVKAKLLGQLDPSNEASSKLNQQ